LPPIWKRTHSDAGYAVHVAKRQWVAAGAAVCPARWRHHATLYCFIDTV